MMNIEVIEQKIGEVLGLEMAAQKAVDKFVLLALLDKWIIRKKLEEIKKEAHEHQIQLQELCEKLSKSSQGRKIDYENVKRLAAETEQKASQIMKTYIGNDPNTTDALEFLCVAEAREVMRYEVLYAVVKDIKDTEFAEKVKLILDEEKEHFQECIELAKENIT